MRGTVALLALVVAAMYLYIAFGVVHRLARVERAEPRAVVAARWGAMVFFAGCAVTHVGIAVQSLTSSSVSAMPGMDMSDARAAGQFPVSMVLIHVIPHVAQILGGAVLILISHRRLELRVLRKDDAERLRTLATQFQGAFELAPAGVALLSASGDSVGRLLQVNPAMCRLLGYADDRDLVGRDHLDFVVEPDQAPAERDRTNIIAGREVGDVERRLRHRDGHHVWARFKQSLVRDQTGAPSFVVVQVNDITDERQREADLRYLADHDAMTDTFNRRRFEEELDRAAAEARRGLGNAALLVVDLDQFKYVNDTYGHAAGDRVLRSVAAALKARLRGSDRLGRLGGDEFGIICPQTDIVAARMLAESLLRKVREDAWTTVEGRTVRVAASIGVTAIDGGPDITSEQVLAAADLAMYEAKEAGRERVSVNAGRAALSGIRSRLAWAERNREALDDDGFRLWEQPILNLATGVCDRSELLIRMIDPADGSIIAPGQLLDAAERLGQIQSIDRWVFREAVSLLALRQTAGDTRAVEINLSGTSLTDETLIDELIEFIAAAPIDPARLLVEITETAAVRNFDLAGTFAHRLADQGCRFLLDDFGAGFGSFTYLKYLPFDGIKIDGEFVKDLPSSRIDQLTVTAVISLAKGLGKEVVAEFVQDDETIAMLKQFGVDYAQGYHIGRPIEVPELARPHRPAPSASSPRSSLANPSPGA